MSPPLNPLETMMAEHRQIERVLSALESCARRVERAGEVQPVAIARFVRFLRGYADELHHGKEEALLFEKMVDAGFPSEAGPVAVMRFEHERGRALVRELKALGEADAWTAEQRRHVSDAALEFSSLLRAHILKEDRILYPMAEQRMPPESMQRLGEECRAFVQRHLDVEADLVALGADLEREWITRDRSSSPSHAANAHAETCPVCGGRES